MCVYDIIKQIYKQNEEECLRLFVEVVFCWWFASPHCILIIFYLLFSLTFYLFYFTDIFYCLVILQFCNT